MAELPSAYDPKLVEQRIYSFWEQHDLFQANPLSSKPPFCIVMPPPNVTGVLHMGHALVSTLQDVLVRYKRMCGYETLWVPGTDHAGIATQTVVERQLLAQYGKRRQEFSREEFLREVWAWKEKSERKIIAQIKSLGCSCDWSKYCFTMDEPRNRAVRTMFKKLFDADLIYRGHYLVNWDPVAQTALADDELEYEERDAVLWTVRYPLEDGSGSVCVATARPETLFGDTALAVHPQDDRHAAWIGRRAVLPLVGRAIPIIADRRVDPEFGTGVVKVTPGHAQVDYEMALEHDLPMINMMTPDGRVNAEGGSFQGLTMEEAKEAVCTKLKEMGLLECATPHRHRVKISYRSKALIEPYLSKQWFVRMSSFKPHLRKAVEEGRVALIPKHWEATYFHWIDHLRDWCISRQLWWGHRIPIWYHREQPDKMVCSVEGGFSEEWVQDPDVLDTWFSSALWPFSTLGWPDTTEALRRFYPTSTLITGHDILFFWVARMLLMGEFALQKDPFPETFLHGLIYGKSYWRTDSHGTCIYVSPEERAQYDLGKPTPQDVHAKWEKMSKSKGNIIDPLEISEHFGTDAMRMALCASATHAPQIDLDRRRFEEWKNFANKVFNGARFVLMHLEGLSKETLAEGLLLDALALEDRWILSRLNRTIQDVTHSLQTYAFDKAAMAAYDFFWKEFCAYYVELVKPTLFGKIAGHDRKETKQKLLLVLLTTTLRLMHPMAPFITEALFGLLKPLSEGVPLSDSLDPYTRDALLALQSPACMVAPFPTLFRTEDIRPEIEKSFALLDQAVHAVRMIRNEMKIPPTLLTDLYLVAPSDEPSRQLLQEHQEILKVLAKIGAVHSACTPPALPFSASQMLSNVVLLIPLPEELKTLEKARLAKEREKLDLEHQRLTQQLANAEFLHKAPRPLVEQLRQKQADAKRRAEEITKRLSDL